MVKFIFYKLQKLYKSNPVDAVLEYRKYFIRIHTYDIYKSRVDTLLRENGMDSVVQEV